MNASRHPLRAVMLHEQSLGTAAEFQCDGAESAGQGADRDLDAAALRNIAVKLDVNF
jgi:hypothetical protein